MPTVRRIPWRAAGDLRGSPLPLRTAAPDEMIRLNVKLMACAGDDNESAALRYKFVLNEQQRS
nr:hypothetical protein GCM10010200_046810 [Actinomadura rugatobispora]